jgi:hypothetical protein
MADESNRNDVRGAGATGSSGLTRLDILRGGLALAASIGIPSTGLSAPAPPASNPACRQIIQEIGI